MIYNSNKLSDVKSPMVDSIINDLNFGSGQALPQQQPQQYSQQPQQYHAVPQIMKKKGKC